MTIKHLPRYLAMMVLLLAFWLMGSSAIQKSATVDEQSHLFRGVAYLQEGATHFLLGHPLLSSTLSALPVLTEGDLALPTEHPSWQAGDWSVAGDLFMWQLGNPSHRMLFLGRLAVIWLTLLLGALVYRWARELLPHDLRGEWAGLIACVLLMLDPTVLANGRFITGDLPLTLFYTGAIYGWWRVWKFGGWRNVILTGLFVGLASATKFNAGLLVFVLGGIAFVWIIRDWAHHSAQLLENGESEIRKSEKFVSRFYPLGQLVVVGAVALAVIWVIYGFSLSPYPGGAFWDDLFWELQYFGKAHGAYFAGEYSTTGWWYYFPIALALKMPLPTMFLLVLALLKFAWASSPHQRWEQGLFLLFPPLLYMGISLTSSLNIGYRYLLPMMPCLAVFTAVALAPLPRATRLQRVLCVALLINAVLIWPNYVPYFNLFAGGSGWQILSDSNVDWGQDLPALAEWQAENGDRPLYLSYFGTARPSAYGVQAQPLPMWSPARETLPADRQPFNPQNPAPGYYAISVTSLHGIILGEQRDAFAYFRQREPIADLNGSIFVYQVNARGEPIDLVLSGLTPSTLEPELAELLDGNEWRIRWIDASQSMLWPRDGGWLMVDSSAEWVRVDDLVTTAVGQSAYQLTPPRFDLVGSATHLDEQMTFLGIRHFQQEGEQVRLQTVWQVETNIDDPLKIFVHGLDANGEIIGQWDGLSSDSISWMTGDNFVQSHSFTIAGELTQLTIGMYHATTLQRLGEGVLVALPDATTP